MNTYIATFFDHYGAVAYSRTLAEKGIKVHLTPVPRRFSSSCGTCAEFEWDDYAALITEDVEHIFAKDGECLYSSM